ncbi:MAG: DUF460 domain-containing protein [Promethearchaeota archaeon]
MKAPTTVIGVDILPMSSPRAKKSTTHFAMVQLNDAGEIIESYPDVSFRDLLVTVRRKNIRYFAIDNLFEIVKDAKGVIRFFETLPSTLTVIQVTGAPIVGYEKVKKIAKRHGLSVGKGKLTPLETAELVARLCLLGVGYVAVPFEEELKCVVSRTKVPGHGGWSQARYRRNLEIAVSRLTEAFASELVERKIVFSKYRYPRRSVFFVETKTSDTIITEIRRITQKLKSDLAQINIQRVPKPRLEFVPLSSAAPSGYKSIRNIIVGIDPGNTTGIAILTLNGRLIKAYSKRELSAAEIVRDLTQIGKGVIVSSDVAPAPRLVEKIASTTGSIVFTPRKAQTSAVEKSSLIDQYFDEKQIKSFDTHARDALFASLSAYIYYKPFLEQIRNYILEKEPTAISYLEEIRGMILKEQKNDIQDLVLIEQKLDTVLENILAKYQQKEVVESPADIIELSEQVSHLQMLLNEARLENEFEQQEIEKLIQEKAAIKKQHSQLFEKFNALKRKKARKMDIDKRVREKEAEVGRLRSEINHLEAEINTLNISLTKAKRIRTIWASGRMVPLKTVSEFRESDIRRTMSILGINKGEVVLILSPSGGGSKTAQLLINQGIRAVLVPKNGPELSHLALKSFTDAQIPVISLPVEKFDSEIPEDIVIQELEGLFVAEKDTLEALIRENEALIIKEEKAKKEIKKKKKILKKIKEKPELDLEGLLDEHKEEWKKLFTPPHPDENKEV